MTFHEIYIEVINKLRIEESDIEPNIEAMLKSGINTAYRTVATKNKRLVKDYIPAINGIVELPTNIVGSIEFDPEIESGVDRIAGDNLLTKRENGTLFTLTYYAVPSNLVEDTDVPDIPDRYMDALVSYPLAMYYLSKKRLDMYQAYKQDFGEILEDSALKVTDQEFIHNAFLSIFR